jgi:hypothetical protein
MKKKIRLTLSFLPWIFLCLLISTACAVAISDDKALARIPFELHRGLVFVNVKVNGQTLNLVVDSAAGHPALDQQKSLAIGLNIEAKGLQSGVHTSSAQTVSIAENVIYQVGAATVTEPFTVVYSFEFLSKAIGRPVDGVLGGVIFRQFVLGLDYPNRVLSVFPPDKFAYEGPGKIVSLEATAADLLVKGKIVAGSGAKEVEGKFSLDTGATEADFVLWNAQEEVKQAAANLRLVESTSFGGSGAASQGNLEEFHLADLVIHQPSVRFINVVDHPSAYACGNIGSNLFQRFFVIFDAPHGRLILEQ